MSTLINTISNENGIKGFIKRNPLISMYIIMFVVAWSVMVPQALYSQGILSASIPEFFEILIGWAPAIAAIIISAVIAGRAGVRELLQRFLIWRVGLRWYLVGAFLLAILILGGIGLHVFFGGTMPAIPVADAPLWQTALIFLVLVLFGFCSIQKRLPGAALPCRDCKITMAHRSLPCSSRFRKCCFICRCSGPTKTPSSKPLACTGFPPFPRRLWSSTFTLSI